MRKFVCCLIFSGFVMGLGIALAGEDFGMTTYPGAKSDPETQAFCSQPEIGLFKERSEAAGLITTKHCYRTSDPLAKVADFYAKQSGAKGGIGTNEDEMKSATYCMSDVCNESSAGTSVLITSPWLVPKIFKMNKDLLIVITNRTKK